MKNDLPKGWKIKKLGDLGSFSKGFGITKDELVEIGIPCIRYGEIYTKHDFVINEYYSFISQETAKLSRKIKKNDILFAGSGETLKDIGKAVTFISDDEVYAGGDTIILSPEGCNSVYLSYILNSQEIVRQRSKLGQGNSVVHIYSKDLGKLNVSIPPLPEQRKIAQILSTWDKAIQTTQHLLDKLESRKIGMMQRLLSGKEKGWETVRFKDCFERVTRRNDEGNTNVLTISAQRGLISQRDFFNKFVASDDVKGYFLLKNGEFSYNKSYSAGYPWGAYKRLDFYDKGILSPLYICFLLKKGCSDFFVHFFEGGFMNRGIYTIAQEGARNHGLLNMSIGDFFELKITVPSFEEQSAIAKILNTADSEIQATKTYLKTLKHQKKGLMQTLLTGKIIVT